jgi:hypothetical protein
VATETYQVQLDRVQSAIAAIEGGAQSYQIRGRVLTRGDLLTLYDREKWLRAQVDREGRGGIRGRLATPV